MKTYLQHLKESRDLSQEVFDIIYKFFCDVLKIKDEILPDGTMNNGAWGHKCHGGASYFHWYGADEKHYGIKVRDLSWNIVYEDKEISFIIRNNEEYNHPIYPLLVKYFEYTLGIKRNQQNIIDHKKYSLFIIPIKDIDVFFNLNSKAVSTFTATRQFDL